MVLAQSSFHRRSIRNAEAITAFANLNITIPKGHGNPIKLFIS